MRNADTCIITPVGHIGGTLRVPGDKSISHRVAMLAALAAGMSEVSGFLDSEDCLNTLRAMQELGCRVDRKPRGKLMIHGTGGLLRRPSKVLDMGNSGTGMRLLAGLLAGQEIGAELTGDPSLNRRPMQRIAEPIAAMGGALELCGAGGRPPVRIVPRTLQPTIYTLPVASAQVKSCILLAGLGVDGETVVIEPRETRDHTERLLRAMGADLVVDGLTVRLRARGRPAVLRGGTWSIPGDFSSAAFWMAAAAARPGARMTLEHVGLNPRRTALLDVLRRMGATVTAVCDGERDDWESAGTVTVKGAALHGTEIGGDEIPNLIDEIPALAVVAAQAEGETVIRDAAELRVKESDRIAVMCEALRAAGVEAEEQPDGMRIKGGPRIAGGCTIHSRGDHRIAMAMSILALSAEAPVTVAGTACIATSYPGFMNHLREVTG